MNLTLRETKGAPLTHAEMDANISMLHNMDLFSKKFLPIGWKSSNAIIRLQPYEEVSIDHMLPSNALTYDASVWAVCPHTGLGFYSDMFNSNFQEELGLVRDMNYHSTFGYTNNTSGVFNSGAWINLVNNEIGTLVLSNSENKEVDVYVNLVYLERKPLSADFIYNKLLRDSTSSKGVHICYEYKTKGSVAQVTIDANDDVVFTMDSVAYKIRPDLFVVNASDEVVYKVTDGTKLYDLIQLSDLNGAYVYSISTIY